MVSIEQWVDCADRLEVAPRAWTEEQEGFLKNAFLVYFRIEKLPSFLYVPAGDL